MYKYFTHNQFKKLIIFTATREINASHFIPLTEEQLNFLEANPTATPKEVQNCQLTVIPEIPLDIIKSSAKDNIKYAALNVVNNTLDINDFCATVASSMYSTDGSSILDTENTFSNSNKYIQATKLCKEKVTMYNALIDEATTKEEVESILNSALPYFDSLEIMPELDRAIESKIVEIDAYDHSSSVNGFYYNSILMWLDKNTRSALVNTINSAELLGRDRIQIWHGDLSVDLELNEARQLLAALELYASECYSVTAQHKAQVRSMTNIDDINAFDITADYPVKLNINPQRGGNNE